MFLFFIVAPLFVLSIKHFGINSVFTEQFFMRSDGVDFAAVHDDNAIRILYRRSALRDNYLCRLRNILAERLAYKRVRARIHRARRVVENKDFGLFE